MLLARIRVGDLVLVDIKGRVFHAEVEDTDRDGLAIRPLNHHDTYRHAKARQVIGHWRKARGGERTPRRCASSPNELQADLFGAPCARRERSAPSPPASSCTPTASHPAATGPAGPSPATGSDAAPTRRLTAPTR
jgi:hypothetical protein